MGFSIQVDGRFSRHACYKEAAEAKLSSKQNPRAIGDGGYYLIPHRAVEKPNHESLMDSTRYMGDRPKSGGVAPKTEKVFVLN